MNEKNLPASVLDFVAKHELDLDQIELIKVVPHDQAVLIRRQETTFGSAGWQGWKVAGDVRMIDPVIIKDNGFVRWTEAMCSLESGAVVFTSAGDFIDRARTFWRQLYYAE